MNGAWTPAHVEGSDDDQRMAAVGGVRPIAARPLAQARGQPARAGRGDGARNARDLYTRRNEGVSIWVVRSAEIVASRPGEHDAFFDPAPSKVYRHPTFYPMPEGVKHL